MLPQLAAVLRSPLPKPRPLSRGQGAKVEAGGRWAPGETFTTSLLFTLLKPCNSGWDLNACAGTQTQPKPRLGLEPTVFFFKIYLFILFLAALGLLLHTGFL